MPILCSKCGFENSEGSSFCSKCGESFSKKSTGKIDLLDNRYEVLNIVKTGGMGCIYKAKDTRLNNIVALKQMLLYFEDEDEKEKAEERFRKEAEMLSRLHHSGLPKVIDFFVGDSADGKKSSHYLVMTFIEGKDLEHIIQERNRKRLSLNKILDYFIQILEILDYLHSQSPSVIYRDMKPSNIMINKGKVYLVDFGIAKRFTSKKTSTIIGTPGFASPEQYKGYTDNRSDIYSLGVVMHYLLTMDDPQDDSRPPFNFRPIRKVNRDVPELLANLVESMIQINPKKRPESVREILDVLGVSERGTAASSSLVLKENVSKGELVLKGLKNSKSNFSSSKNKDASDELIKLYQAPSTRSQEGSEWKSTLKVVLLILFLLGGLFLVIGAYFKGSYLRKRFPLENKFFLEKEKERYLRKEIQIDKEEEKIRKKNLQVEKMQLDALQKEKQREIERQKVFMAAQKKQNYISCQSNCKVIGTALELYASDHRGKYPKKIAEIVPSYLKRIPDCPAVDIDTYSPSYSSSSKNYFFYCKGKNHVDAGALPNYPQYNSSKGLVKGAVGK